MKKLLVPLLLYIFLLQAFKASGQTLFSSYPSATATIFLDFDGEAINSPLWNGGTPFVCSSAALTNLQIQEIFNRVAEDYRPFNINITTDEAVFVAAPLNKRIRVVVTSTSAWYPGVGGIAYVGSFKWGDDTPCFVFSSRLGNSTKMVAECCSHESGHTLGLSHQSKYDGGCNLTATYNAGIGTGEVSWAPIMGNSYYRNMSGWNNGPTPYGCNNIQDNLSIITTQNGFTYRADEVGDDINTTPVELGHSNINLDGLISTSNDKDAFQLTIPQNENFHLAVTPFSVNLNNEGANLDVRLSLYNENKILLRTYDPATTMDVVVDTILNTGIYYLIVDGTGNSNVSNYGSLGSYKMVGLSSVLPICSIQLSGIADKNIHRLQWGITCNETIHSIEIQSSADGVHFITINTFSDKLHNYVYSPITEKELYYRLKINTLSNWTAFSNIIILKKTIDNSRKFIVSNLVHQEINIQAGTAFQYQLTDVNGNRLLGGSGKEGTTKINVSKYPKGMYILQFAGNNIRGELKQTERIVIN